MNALKCYCIVVCLPLCCVGFCAHHPKRHVAKHWYVVARGKYPRDYELMRKFGGLLFKKGISTIGDVDRGSATCVAWTTSQRAADTAVNPIFLKYPELRVLQVEVIAKRSKGQTKR